MVLEFWGFGETLRSQNGGYLLGNGLESTLAVVSLSNRTVQRRISDMAIDVKDQIVQEVKSASRDLFSIRLDESTGVASCSQLLVLTRYVHSGSFKAKASDILEKFHLSLNQKIFCEIMSVCAV